MPGPRTILERLFSLDERTVLITGASGGIGRALALAMAEAGASVGVHGATEEKVEETRRLVEEAGGRAIAFTRPLGEAEASRDLIRDAHRALGRLDVLVNCAGMNRRKPVEAVSEDDYETILAVNLRSVFFLCQEAAPILRAQGGGKIINIGSMTSLVGLGGLSVYGMTKAALWQLTRTLALELAPDNIQVNCLAPGFIVTPLTEEGVWGDPHKRRWLLERIPAARPGVPEDLVGAALLLASPASAYLTGQILAVDGGYLAGGSWLRREA